MRQRLPGREQRDGVPEHSLQFGGQVIGFATRRGDDEQRAGTRQRGGGEQPRAGRTDHRQRVGPAFGAVDQIQEGGRGERQVDEPRDRDLDMSVPRCGHDGSIVGGLRPVRNSVRNRRVARC